MSTNTPQPQPNEEVDLGQLFKLIGNMFDRFFKFIGGLFKKLFLAFVWLVFFIKKHIIILAVATVIGFAIGWFKEFKSEPAYKSVLTVKQNYNFGENLYSTIDYYNRLLRQEDYSTLAGVLEIDSTDVSSILNFEIEAIVSDKEKLVEFNTYTKKLDSSLVATLDYKEYLGAINDYVYELQQITILSSADSNFDKVFNGIVKSFSSNPHFKREQEKDLRQLQNREEALNAALIQSDSLKNTYKKVLENALNTSEAAQTSITIEGSDEKNKTKEFDLYLNDIELRKELVNIAREKENREFILEAVSNSRSKGFIDSSMQVFGKSISSKIFYTLVLPGLLLLGLMLLRFVKYLEKYQNEI